MKQVEHINSIGYKIVKIQTTKFEFEEIEADTAKTLFTKNNNLRIDMRLEINVNAEKELVTFKIQSTVVRELDEKQLFQHIGMTSFNVIGLENLPTTEEGTYELPNELIITFYSLAYSHNRALLAQELASTMYRDLFFLPIIDPATILNL